MSFWLVCLGIGIALAYLPVGVGLFILLGPFFRKVLSDHWFEDASVGPDFPPFLFWPIFIPLMVTWGTITLLIRLFKPKTNCQKGRL